MAGDEKPMTTMRQASNINMAGWQPTTTPVATTTPKKPTSAPDDPRTRRNSQMLAAMPLMATSSDSLTRQFYGGSNLPTYRILPAKRGGGS
jgi:hypothetical protein